MFFSNFAMRRSIHSAQPSPPPSAPPFPPRQSAPPSPPVFEQPLTPSSSAQPSPPSPPQQTDNKSTCSTAFEIEIPGTAVKQNMKSLDEVTCCSPALAAKSSLCFTNFGEVHFFRVDDHVSPAVPCTFDLSSGILGCTGGLLGLFGLICTFLGLGLAVSGLSCVFAGGIRGLVGALLGLASGLGLFGLDSLLGGAGSGVACVFVGGLLSFADGLFGLVDEFLGRRVSRARACS